MVSGCGLSRKTNRRTGTSFLYFWWYEDGEKHEKYLGRTDNKKAELKGVGMMLSFYRKQDEELHRKIGELVKNLVTSGRGEPISPLPDTSAVKLR
ncbi:MAG: hypothetical protein ACE5KU_03400, partial [Nitrososphaerales archaeon]